MQNPDELAQEALKFLELAQNFEEKKNAEKAISHYQKAAEYLKQSGILTHRIKDIYERIEELKNFLKHEKLYERTQIQTQIEQVQDQAFSLLEGAKELESNGLYEDAIQQYMAAINLLAQSGWSEVQLENLRVKIKNITDNVKQRKEVQLRQQQEIISSEQISQQRVEQSPQIVGMFGEKTTPEKAEAITKYREQKRRKEEVQNEAFSLIDKAKIFEKEKRFDNAINNYKEAVQLLNSIGWTAQTQNILAIIEKFKKDKEHIENFQAQQKQAISQISSKIEGESEALTSEADLKRKKLIEFEEKKKIEEQIQIKAFNLIDIGKKFEREKDYNQAIEKLEEAIQLFKSIEWDSYIQPVIILINNIKEKQEREEKAEHLKEKREKELFRVQESIYLKEMKQAIESAKDLENKREEFELKKRDYAEKEKDLFKILDKADEILKEKNFERAINEYNKALVILEDLGTGWETYINTIKNTILNIEKIKNSRLKKQYEDQKRLEKREQAEIDFQKQIATQLNKERERLKKKEIILKEKEEEVKYFKERRKKAFEFLDSALNFVKKGEYDNAIEAYQNAGNIFAEIRWTDEIPLIENSIHQVEELQRDQKILRQKKMQEVLEREKKEEDFQKQITKYLKQEREKLKKQEIELREQEKELQYREERRKAGFKLLEESQDNLEQGHFDKAIEILQYAINFFADANWQNEISLIQNSIIEIENQKKEAELQKQLKIQADFEREKEEKRFQELITKEMKAQREKLKEKEIALIEKENLRAYQANKKNEAFDLLEKAQNFLSFGKFDDALEIYYDIANIFAQVQWTEEIPIIQTTIEDIKEKKRENELYKQKLLRKAIEKETADKVFMNKILLQREREKVEALKEQKILEKQKKISAQNLVEQERVFQIIEQADNILNEEKFTKAIENYKNAIEILKGIGWREDYLKLLKETIQTIQESKERKEKEKQLEFEAALNRQKEEEQFQNKISNYIRKEKERLKFKEIEVQKREDLLQKMEKRKIEAFEIMDQAEELLNQGEYDKQIELYRKSELILNEISFPTTIIRETIQKIQEKKRDDDLNKLKELELNLRREQEEHLFQQQIAEKMKLEQLKMKEKEEDLRKLEEIRLITEKRKEEAFKLLEEAQKHIEQNDFDKAITVYQNAADIFTEIQWHDEIDLIQRSINAVENKKHDMEVKKQIELKASLEREKEEKLFHELISEEMKTQREKLKQREIKLRKKEEELAYREKKREEGFKLLDKAQDLLSKGRFEESIDIYRDVANIFAQIQWDDEVPILENAIQNIMKKKREDDILKAKLLQESIGKEKANYEFMEQIQLYRKKERAMAIEEGENLKSQKLISAQNLVKQQEAFNLINNGYELLKQQDFDLALVSYQHAIHILTEIGWTSEYLKLLTNTIITIEKRKRDLEKQKEIEQELKIKQEQEQQQFQSKISESMLREKKRLELKEIKIQERENLLQKMESRKIEAFEIMDHAENLLTQAEYDKATEMYRKAELNLSEMGFPTNLIREMIYKVQMKSREEITTKQMELESKLQKEREQFEFQQKIAESIKINELKMKSKQNELERQKEYRAYMEKRKDEAFSLLDEAEIYLNQVQYDKALEYYHTAELILNEISFPTESIRETIQKVRDKKKEHRLQRQRDLELSIQRERKVWEFEQKTSTYIKNEKKRLQNKQIEIQEKEELKARLEKRKEHAFKILDDAEKILKASNYENAIKSYRKAGLILNELQFPTDSINSMILKVNKLKKQKEEQEELKFQKEIEKLEEEKALKILIDERKRQEEEKKRAQLLAQEQRERMIQEQMTVRESAYSLLEEAGKYLKQLTPDFNNAISLYVQARNILAENIGWEPEINNLNTLIKDLQQEQVNYIKKKKLEEETRIQRQIEYQKFQEEVRRRRLEQEQLKREQEKQYRELFVKKKHIHQIRDEGLKFIDDGKRLAAYHDFENAYKKFNTAISKFKEIGWKEEIKYIETEIKNAKILEERVKAEESRIYEIQKQLVKQRILEKSRRESKDAEMKQAISEVSIETDKVMKMIEKGLSKTKSKEKEQKQQIKHEAKEFSKKMSDLIKIKQELIDEIEKKEMEKKKEQKRLKQAKEREEIDNLKKMIKESDKSKKN